MTKALWIAALAFAYAGLATAGAPSAAPCGPTTGVQATSGYPTFCSIPATPTDVRPAAAFRAAVIDTRRDGRRVRLQSAEQTFTLPVGEADSFSLQARLEAAPPAAEAQPAEADSEAFAAEARRRVTPPARAPR